MPSIVRVFVSFGGSQRFELQGRLGQGAYGVVYRAFDRQRNAPVALKTLHHIAPDALMRFKAEFRALQDLQHHNLVHLGELHESTGEWFFTMELVEGVEFLEYIWPDLSSDESRQTLGVRFHEERLRDALRQLVAGLEAVHRAGFVHRDIKPSNIRVQPDGRVVLLDFGLVTQSVEAELTADTAIVGTPAYMAPEQALSRPVSAAADWYSLGVLLWQALVGELPLTGAPIQLMVQKQNFVPDPPSKYIADVPPDLEELCLAMMRVDPKERPRGAEIARRLATDSRPPSAQEVSSSGPKRGPFVGRSDELAQLRRCFEEARSGALRAVFVEGESGLGKSSLVEQFARDVSADVQDVVVLAGRCYEHEAVPYKAFDGIVDALGRYLQGLSEDACRAVLPRKPGLLPRMFPVLGRVRALADVPLRGVPIDPVALRDQSFAAVIELFGRLAERTPLVLTIDDLQWADEESLLLLDELCRPPITPPLLLVVTGRDPSECPAFVAEAIERLVDPGRGGLRIALDGLSRQEGLDLAQRLLQVGGPAADDWADAIIHESAGHPMFISELVRHVQRAALRGQEAIMELDAALQARVDELPVEEHSLLRIAAVAGRPIPQNIAAEVAGLEPNVFSKKLKALRVAKLVRTHTVGENATLEAYHDRIRKAAVRGLTEDEQRSTHFELGEAIEAGAAPDAEHLAHHFRQAGESLRAAPYSLAAADKAAEALAFAHAATLYRDALDLNVNRTAVRQREILVKLGDALGISGRGSDAGDAYMSAVVGAPTAEALELKRRATARYLQSGRIDDGLRVADEILAAIDMRLPSTPVTAVTSLLWNRARVEFGGIRFRERAAEEVDDSLLQKIDIVSSIGTALSMVDFIRGADFHARALRLALKSGERARVAKALANEAATKASTESQPMPKARALLVQASELAERIGDPQAIAHASLAWSMSNLVQMDFPPSIEAGWECDRILRERCTDVAWALGTAHCSILINYWNVGRYDLLNEHGPRFFIEAQDRGDLYAKTMIACGGLWAGLLAEDKPEEAVEVVEDSMRKWGRTDFQLQHYLELQALTDIAMYRGGPAAYERLVATWPAFKKSKLTMALSVKFTALQGRARAALIAAPHRSGRRTTLLKRAERDLADARKLMKAPANRGLIDLFEAGLAASRGRPDVAVAGLRRADGRLMEGAMAGYAASARARLGALLGGDEGAKLTDDAKGWLRDHGVQNPERYIAMRAPGFD